MTRTILATATALLGAMTLLTPAAEACVSCEYTPEVARSHSSSHEYYSHDYGAAHYRVKRVYVRAIEHSAGPAKKRIVKSEPVAKKVDTAKAAPVETPEESETQAQTENSSISTATLQTSENVDADEAPAPAPKASTNIGCKKFFPTVGMTLTVPCE
jgi:hypothetical protein